MNNKVLGRPTKVDVSGYYTTEFHSEFVIASYRFPSPLLCNVNATYLPTLQPFSHLPDNDGKMLVKIYAN